MLLFYQEPNGDYLCVEHPAYKVEDGQHIFSVRATAIEGLIGSVCTTATGQRFLKMCKRIAKRNVPKDWMTAMVGGSGN